MTLHDDSKKRDKKELAFYLSSSEMKKYCGEIPRQIEVFMLDRTVFFLYLENESYYSC